MTVASGNFAELLWPGIHDIWGQKYTDWPALYPKIFTMKRSTLAFEKEQGVTGLGLASIKGQGNPIDYDDPFQGYQQEYVNVTYSLGTVVTREMFEDDQYNYINGLPGMLAKSLRQTEETIAFNHINRAQNTNFTGADGVTLANASHPLVGGGTFRNQLATAADLTQTSLEQACQDIMDWVDDRSLKVRLMPKCLLVPTQLNFTARRLMESEYIVGSADNDKSGIPGLFQDLVVSPYLTDSDAWTIVTDSEDGLIWYTRRAAEINRDNEFDTQNLKFATTTRFVSSWTNPRGIFFSPGA